jgi:hypothetical protein
MDEPGDGLSGIGDDLAVALGDVIAGAGEAAPNGRHAVNTSATAAAATAKRRASRRTGLFTLEV